MSGVIHSRLETAGTKPTTSEVEKAELVVNLADKELWTKDHNGNVIKVGSSITDASELVFTPTTTIAAADTQAAVEEVDAKVVANGTSAYTTASAVLVGDASISNLVNTKNFAAVDYTGNGATQDITTGISSVDFTVSGNGSGYWIKRGKVGMSVIADDAVDMVTNGTDVVDTTGWTAYNGATLSVSNGSIVSSVGAADGGFTQNITTVVGQEYTIMYTTSGIRSAYLFIDGVEQNPGTLAGTLVGTVVTTFVAQNTSTEIKFVQGTTSDVDDLIVGSIKMFSTSAEGTTDWSTYNATSSETPRGLCRTSVKKRTGATDRGMIVTDGLRGIASTLITSSTATEGGQVIDSLTTTGVTLSPNDYVNTLDETYILYQTLYTHIKWGTNNQGKKYVEAYNLITKETMIIYEGSGVDGHEVPHSLGVALDYSEIKALTVADKNWMVQWKKETKLWLNSDNTSVDGSGDFSRGVGHEIVHIGSSVNIVDETYILYGKANSATWKIVEYVGTGASNNYVEVGFRPARVIIKAVDATGGWAVQDNKRGSSLTLWMNTDGVENAGYYMTFYNSGITLDSASGAVNADGVKYIALVEADTNADGGGSYFDKPTANSNLNVDGVFTYTDGFNDKGFNRLAEKVTASVPLTGVSDGLKWIAKVNGGGYEAKDTKPTFNTDEACAEYNVVKNGELSNGIDNWVASADTAISVESGGLKVEVTGNNEAWATATQYIPIEQGVTYTIKIDKIVDSGSTFGGWVGVNDTVDFRGGYIGVGILGTFEYTFTAVTDGNLPFTIYVRAIDGDIGDYIVFDNISVTNNTRVSNVLSFIDKPVYIVSEVPQYFGTDKLMTNNMDSLRIENDVEVGGDVSIAGNLSGMSGFDLGQSLVDETANMSFGTTYTNNTNKSIKVFIRLDATDTTNGARLSIDGFTESYIYNVGDQTTTRFYMQGEVPIDSTYKLDDLSGMSIVSWFELK